MEAASNRRAKINDRRRDCAAIPDTEPGLQAHSWLFPPSNDGNLVVSQPALNLERFKSTIHSRRFHQQSVVLRLPSTCHNERQQRTRPITIRFGDCWMSLGCSVAVFLRSQHEKHSKAVTSRSKQVDLQYLWKNVSLGRNRDAAFLQRTLQDDRFGALDQRGHWTSTRGWTTQCRRFRA